MENTITLNEALTLVASQLKEDGRIHTTNEVLVAIRATRKYFAINHTDLDFDELMDTGEAMRLMYLNFNHQGYVIDRIELP